MVINDSASGLQKYYPRPATKPRFHYTLTFFIPALFPFRFFLDYEGALLAAAKTFEHLEEDVLGLYQVREISVGHLQFVVSDQERQNELPVFHHVEDVALYHLRGIPYSPVGGAIHRVQCKEQLSVR